MDISIVIPVLNESKKIGADIEAASLFLESNHLTGEIIVVDDGSDDRTSEAAKNVTVPSTIELKVIHYDDHRGKGYATRTGIGKASGEYVMFADCGGCVPYRYILDGLKLLKSEACDIAHGSRKLAESKIQKPQGWYRRICASVFQWVIHRSMRISCELTDTQCGFKIYRGDVARNLYTQCVTDGFMFDLEIIIQAEKQGYRIKEFPIEWSCDRDSRLSPARSLWHVLRELKTIKRMASEGNHR
ncbi:MAG: glycosyltransferase [Planctomycetota bacterium]|jgi:dolichyl-phosphate beta-glucosyltransferase